MSTITTDPTRQRTRARRQMVTALRTLRSAQGDDEVLVVGTFHIHTDLPADPRRESHWAAFSQLKARCSRCMDVKPYEDFPSYLNFNVYARRNAICNACRGIRHNDRSAA
jgi:hypothetical protein